MGTSPAAQAVPLPLRRLVSHRGAEGPAERKRRVRLHSDRRRGRADGQAAGRQASCGEPVSSWGSSTEAQ